MSDDLRGNAAITEERAVRILGEIREKDKSLLAANLKISDQETEIETLRKNLEAAQEKIKAAQEVTKHGIVPNELTESTLETVSKLSQPIVIKPEFESDSLKIKLDGLSWRVLEFLETSEKTGELVTEKILQHVLGKMGTEEKKKLSDSLNRLLEQQFVSKIRPENQAKFIYSITHFGKSALKNKSFYDHRNQEASTLETKEVQPSKDSIELNNLARVVLNKSVSKEEMTGGHQTVREVKNRHGEAPLFDKALSQLETQGLWEVVGQDNSDDDYYKATDKGKRAIGRGNNPLT